MSKQRAIDAIGFGSYNHIYVKFENVWWPKECPVFVVVNPLPSEDPFTVSEWFNYAFKHHGCAVLCGDVAASSSQRFEKLSEGEVFEIVKTWMKKLAATLQLPSSSLHEPTEIFCTRWGQDPLSFGAFSYMSPGASQADADVLLRPSGSLFFAGEHCSRKYPNTLHGALLTGEQAAKSVCKALQNQQP
mmetsp:Transcript_23576/g.46429  ORF Transcript_23576/g.46429 Transcript_23576/m.46429 type:complete len:188 (+) Transcript_23576:1298-1861(+)